MTEYEWLGSTDPSGMLKSPKCDLTPRRLRLLIGAFCRHLWDHPAEHATRVAVEVAERAADGELRVGELKAAQLGAGYGARYAPSDAVMPHLAVAGVADHPWAWSVGERLGRLLHRMKREDFHALSCLLRDVTDPF